MRIAVAQINCTVGDFPGNVERILDAATRAAQAGAQVLVTPELSLCGYPPEDLLLRPEFHRASERALDSLAQRLSALPAIAVVVGHPLTRDGSRFNAASVLLGGKSLGTYLKRELPNYQVFDEQRYFQSGDGAFVFDLGGVRFGLNICEDTWFEHAPACAAAAGAQVLLVPNASPFHLDKQNQRLDVLRQTAASQGMGVVYANLVGGQDELVFDGASFVLDPEGAVVAAAKAFDEDLLLVDWHEGRFVPGRIEAAAPPQAQAYAALRLGLKDYVEKNGFPGTLIGLSGGVDSALTLALAVDALGAERVRAVMMPSEFTADISLADARDMAARLGVRYDELPIRDLFEGFVRQLQPQFAGLPWDATEENLQARVRGMLLMALSNKTGSIVLTTGNKSEMAVGYCTLYGDMAGGFAVIRDLTKRWVYRLCDYRNGLGEVIPRRILERPPSAELRPNQTDQDSLPPYDILDSIIECYMEQDRSIDDIIGMGLPPDDVRRVVRLIRLSEYKRRQAPVGIRITHRAFGRDWRYPITNRFREEIPPAV